MTIDLESPLEAEVLSQFFDHDYDPIDYINALVSASINSTENATTNNNNNLTIRRNEINSDISLKLFSEKCMILSSHFNEYINELSKRFDQNYEKLINSSNQIISYNESDKSDESDNIETRLQYHLKTLNSSMFLLLEDLKITRDKLNMINDKGSNSNLIELRELMENKSDIEKILKSYDLLKSIVESNIDNENEDVTNINEIKLEDFKKSINGLKNLIKDQIDNEIQIVKNNDDDNDDDTNIEINEKLLKIIDNLIDLQPLFKSIIYFQTVYSSFVDFLKIEKSKYIQLFNKE